MRAGDLNGTGAEFRIRIFVANDRDQAAMLFRSDRNFAQFANDWCIAFIGWMNRNGTIAQHGFRACRGDGKYNRAPR